MALTMDPPWGSMGAGPLIFHGKPMEYFCKGQSKNTMSGRYFDHINISSFRRKDRR